MNVLTSHQKEITEAGDRMEKKYLVLGPQLPGCSSLVLFPSHNKTPEKMAAQQVGTRINNKGDIALREGQLFVEW